MPIGKVVRPSRLDHKKQKQHIQEYLSTHNMAASLPDTRLCSVPMFVCSLGPENVRRNPPCWTSNTIRYSQMSNSSPLPLFFFLFPFTFLFEKTKTNLLDKESLLQAILFRKKPKAVGYKTRYFPLSKLSTTTRNTSWVNCQKSQVQKSHLWADLGDARVRIPQVSDNFPCQRASKNSSSWKFWQCRWGKGLHAQSYPAKK
jgi:hypothetical protein